MARGILCKKLAVDASSTYGHWANTQAAELLKGMLVRWYFLSLVATVNMFFFSEYHPAHRPLRHQLEITSPSKFTVRCMNPRTLKIYRSPLPEFSVTRNRFLVSPYSDTSSSDLWASGRFILPHTTHDTTCPFSEGRSRRPPRQCVYFRGFVLMSL